MLHAATSSFGAFFALRFLLGKVEAFACYVANLSTGMCECCVAPILILITSMFYKKNEQVRCPTFLAITHVLKRRRASVSHGST